MIVPAYWAEARLQKRFPDRQITVRRFGWSDVSLEDAQRHADGRVQEAFDRIVAGEKLPRRERKVRYNGADNLPIREEIIERFGECVVTRNSYGARCLNTPNVFFADIDFPESPMNDFLGFTLSLLSLILGTCVWVWQGSLLLGILTMFVSLAVNWKIAVSLYALSVGIRGGQEQIVRKRIEAFVATHNDWHLRIYRTPNGFRLLAMHQLFDPRSKEVDQAFRALHVDRTYVVMCQKQNCFRARLTAKPWRVGIDEHLKPRPGVWPIDASRLPERIRWVDEYESTSANFSACRFEMAVGATQSVSSVVRQVADFHDRICRANDGLPLA